MTNALASIETARTIARHWRRDVDSGELSIEGLHLLESAMATPGLVACRQLLQLAGLAPAVVYSNGVLLPLNMLWRAHGLASFGELSEVDVTRELVELATSPSAGDEDPLITALSVKTQARWDAFDSAERGHYRRPTVAGDEPASQSQDSSG